MGKGKIQVEVGIAWQSFSSTKLAFKFFKSENPMVCRFTSTIFTNRNKFVWRRDVKAEFIFQGFKRSFSY